MSPQKTYDSSNVRASALFALASLAKGGDEASAKAFSECVSRLRNPTKKEKDEGILDPLMEDYLRQAEARREGKAAEAMPMPPVEPEFTVRKL